MLRRELFVGLAGLGLSGCAAGLRQSSELRGPPLWLAAGGRGRVYILGFADAKDHSWFTPTVQRAFEESSELWLENAPIAPSAQRIESEQKAAELEALGYESGRTFFEALEPHVRQRTIAFLAEVDLRPESIEKFRPWRAYYVLNAAYWSKKKLTYEPVPVDAVLREFATKAQKTIRYEMPTREHFIRFMAAMSDRAQSQYIEWLLDYIEDDRSGLNERDSFSWISGVHGSSALRSLDRMRSKAPDLYAVMQPRRNEWWARQIEVLLATDKTCFIGVGQLHVMGADRIPSQLKRMGITLRRL
jgi:uncharacterized protein YbaP (TraB family)